jgi:hypothetical protein
MAARIGNPTGERARSALLANAGSFLVATPSTHMTLVLEKGYLRAGVES